MNHFKDAILDNIVLKQGLHFHRLPVQIWLKDPYGFELGDLITSYPRLYSLAILQINRRTDENFRIGYLISKHFELYSGKLHILTEGDKINWKYSIVLEPWIEIYSESGIYLGCISKDIFKREFKTHSNIEQEL